MKKPVDGLGSVEAQLQLNRCLYEGRGDDFIVALAAYVMQNKLHIGEQSLEILCSAARSIRARKS